MAGSGIHVNDPGATDGGARVLTTTPASNDPGLVVRPIGTQVISGAVTIADGSDVTLGAISDAAVLDAAGTVNAHVRGIVKQLIAGIPVTNAGTFAVQASWASAQHVIVDSGAVTVTNATASNLKVAATLDAETTKVIGVTRSADGSGNLLTSTGSALDVNLKTSAASNLSTNVAQINGVTPLMGAGNTGTGSPRVTIATDQLTLPVGGTVASGASDTGNPVGVGGLALTAPPTAVSTTQRVRAMFDIYGKQIVRECLREDLANQATTITTSTAETTIVTADGTYKLDLYGLVLSNSSGTATNVTIKDSTSGTTRFTIYVPAGDTRGFTLPIAGAHKQNAANTNWTATSSASITSLFVTALTVRSL